MTAKRKQVKEARPSPLAKVLDREPIPIAVLLLLAIVIRLIYLLEYRASLPYYYSPIVDSAFYDSWANAIVEGIRVPLPFYMPPLYPYTLALIYRVLGHHLVIVYIWQLCLGVYSTLLTYVIGRRVFGHFPGLLAMLLLILYAPFMYLDTKLLTEPLAVALNLTALLLLMRALDSHKATGYFAAGLVFGLSALCRPVAFLTIAAVIAWLVFVKSLSRKRTAVSALVIGMALMILPVTIRNYRVGKDFVLVSSNGGMVFAQGNHEHTAGLFGRYPGFTGSIFTQQQESLAIAEQALGRKLKPSESSNYWFKRGLTFVREHPARFLRLVGLKLIWSFHNRESPCNYNIYLERLQVPILRCLPLPFSILGALGILGFVFSLRKRSFASDVLGLYLVSVLLSLLLFMVSSRFRTPMVPALAIFGGFGIQTLASKPDRRGMTLAAACTLPILLISLVRPPMPKITGGALTNLGVSYLASNRVDEAIVQFRKALVLNPRVAQAHLGLANALFAKGELDEAIEHYRSAVSFDPGNAKLLKKLASALSRAGLADEAVVNYRKVLAIEPGDSAMHCDLGVALLSQGKMDESVDHFRTAIRISPDFAEAHQNLGAALSQLGKTDEAIVECRRAIQIKPDLPQAHSNLAVALYDKADYLAAWEEVHWCTAHGFNPNPGFVQALSGKMRDPGK